MFYPILFTFRDVVSGKGYLSEVILNGRVLLFQDAEDGLWWAYGVRPGAIAAPGTTAMEAHNNFRARYTSVLFDFASSSETFDAFRGQVERFYDQPDDEEEARWEEAVRAIRDGAATPEEALAKLPREAPETRPPGIFVARLDRESSSRKPAPTDNVPDLIKLVAA